MAGDLNGFGVEKGRGREDLGEGAKEGREGRGNLQGGELLSCPPSKLCFFFLFLGFFYKTYFI